MDDPEFRAWVKQNEGFQTSAWPLEVWDLQSITLAAFYFNPDLDVARANAALADAAIKTAAMKPNPSVSFGPGFQGPADTQFIMGLNFSLPIETAGKRGYRVAAAEHLSEASRLQLGQVAWTVRSRVRVALVDHIFALKSVELLQKEVALRGEYVQRTETRFRAGEIPLPDVTAARIDLFTLRQTLSIAEGQAETTEAALAAAVGVPVSALNGKTFVLPGADQPPQPDALPPQSIRAAAVQNRLDVRRALEQYEASQSTLQLQVAQQYPDINLGPGYSYEEATNFISLSLSSVLPIRNQNQGPIAEAEAQRKLAGAQLLSVQSGVIADTDKALAQYTASYTTLDGATKAIRLLEQQEQSAKRLLQAGETEQFTVVAAQLQTSVAERARFDALHQAQLSLGLIEDALQKPVDLGGTVNLPKQAPR
ncbi:MAG: TolC family protein [Acidobacteria bacterium]|nr:TolC family protein [Acidobacteriota bacterium]